MKLTATVLTDSKGVKTAFVDKFPQVVVQAKGGENIRHKLSLAWKDYIATLSMAKFEFQLVENKEIT